MKSNDWKDYEWQRIKHSECEDLFGDTYLGGVTAKPFYPKIHMTRILLAVFILVTLVLLI